MNCNFCDYNDGYCYLSNPPQYKCTITGKFHFGTDKCDVEFAPIKHGYWIDKGDFWVTCSVCGEPVVKNKHDVLLRSTDLYNYCPNCGAKMD